MRFRAPRPEDRDAVFAVLSARDLADLGEVDWRPEGLADEWRAPGFDLAGDARLVELDGIGIAAYAAVRHEGAFACVAPEQEGRGIGARLLRWVESRELAVAHPRHRQIVAASNERAAELLAGAGYERVRSYLRMHRSLEDHPATPPPPDGVVLRPADPRGDAVALHGIDARAFREAEDYVPEPLELFRSEHLAVRNLDRASSLVACRGERIVGFLLAQRWEHVNVGFIDLLAVDPPEQGSGIGGVLLASAFAALAAGGLGAARLGVASGNRRGRRLYERFGMKPRYRFDVYERDAASPTTRTMPRSISDSTSVRTSSAARSDRMP